MTVRGLLLSVAVLASAPTEAASCHRYSVWHYPWRQRCAEPVRHSREKTKIELPPNRDIPIPFLARSDCQGGEADELTRARLMLLGYAYAH